MDNIKNISIKKFLAVHGILPIYDRQSYGMYLSPFRTESEPSFKVDYTQNLWYDFGAGTGGSIIDLVMKLENCSVNEAMKRLENNNSFSFHRNEAKESINSTLQISAIKPLQDSRLTTYLQSKRRINIEIARHYCKEVHYFSNGKSFFAIGFQSDNGG